MKLKVLLLTGILCCLGLQELFAQGKRTITGTVITAEDPKGLPGVTVKAKNGTDVVVTDINGKYKLTIPISEDLVVFSFIGYETTEVSIAGKTILDVTLTAKANELKEMVVIGYGARKKSDLTGSVSQVKAKEINAYPSNNVLQSLSGRAAGVQVVQNSGSPGGSVSVRIRGTNSIQGSNEPLYVVDGFPVAGNPTTLSNADIESIDILKDASATAIYGSRGANGVVLITTKRGKAGKTLVDVESTYGSQSIIKKLKLMDATEYANFYNEQAANDKVAPYFTPAQVAAMGAGFDWQDFILRKAPMLTENVSVTGGNDKTQFALAANVLAQDGIVKSTFYNRYSLRANINHDISKKVSLSLVSLLTKTSNNSQNGVGGGRGETLFASALQSPPTLTPFNADGSYRVLATAYPFISNVIINPVNFINEQTAMTKSNRVLLNGAVTYKPIDGLVIRFSGGVENADDRSDSYRTRQFVNSQGIASVSSNQFTSLLSENTISYTKGFGRHNINALAGFTYQDFLSTTLGGSGIGFISDASQTYDLASALTPGIPTSGYSKSTLLSYLSRLNYTYNDRYLLTLSFRADGSSKYSTGNKWGYFPSGALAWRVSQESFMKNVKWISDLKARIGWGYTGSQAINAYATLNQLGSSKTVFGDALYTAYAPGTRLPGNLKWETTEQKDAGIDLGLFNNLLSITADYYIKTTRDLLNTVQLPASLGFTTTIQNVGEVQNKGFEFGLGARPFSGPFKWDFNANISFNRNKALKLYGGQDILGGFISVSSVTDNANIIREGLPMGSFFGYVEDGYTSTGTIKYKDLDGDGNITANDKAIIGNPFPKMIYGFNSNMSFKNFELSFFIQGSQGNDLFNINAINSTLDYGYGLNMPKDVYYNHWTPTNTNAKYPKISRANSVSISNRFVENGSYLRLKNIQLAYSFPVEKLKLGFFRNLQLGVSAQNILTFTKYSWYDPEVNSNGGANSTSQGFDNYTYPNAKTITISFRAGF